MQTIDIPKTQAFACALRADMLRMTLHAGANGGHLGGSFSAAEIMACLFCGSMKQDPKAPEDPERDRFILSKGHASLVYYAALCEAGYFSRETLMTFEDSGGEFPTHAVQNPARGIELSSGSLGWGLSYGIGCAIAAKRQGRSSHTYVLMGDGECNEGSVWEAFMAGARFGVNNLTAIIDKNRQQLDGFDVMPLYDCVKAIEGFGWNVVSIDGHDVAQIAESLRIRDEKRPTAVIANTCKGRGVSFMEDIKGWHHARLTDEQCKTAMCELGVRE